MDSSRPSTPSLGADDFGLYLKLYKHFIEKEIKWSEGNSLTPQYLHLNEHDIGNVGDYSMKGYISGFVYSLGECLSALEKIVFCYSFEESSGLPPQNCTRSQFYAFELKDPGSALTPEQLNTAIIGYERGESKRPDPRPLEGVGGLIDVLSDSNLVQPYIVEMIDPLTVNCIHDIQSTSEQTLRGLVEDFKRTGCYQFSIYGYQFKPQAVDLWVNSETRRAFLEHAFILHILHWNHGLRSAHERASAFGRTLKEVKGEWEQARAKAENVFAKLGTVVGRGTSVIDPVSILPVPPLALDPGTGLFRRTLGHTFKSFPKESTKDSASTSFKYFYQDVRRYATTEGYRALGNFVDACGAVSYLTLAHSVSSEQRESWEKAIFWSTKLLSRRIQPNQEGHYNEDFYGIGPDQVILAVLFGISRSGRTDPKVTVRYSGTIEGSSLSLSKQRQVFLENIRIEDPDHRKFWEGWPKQSWMWLDERLGLEWPGQSSDTTSTPLENFVRSGLLRSEESLVKETQLYVPGDVDEKSKQRYDGFLAKLALLIELCAKGDISAGELRLEEISLNWDVCFTFGGLLGKTIQEKKSVLTLEINCQGKLRSRERKSTGVFSGTLWGLNDFFSTSLRTDPGETVPGVYYITEGESSRLRLVLKSVGQEE